MGEPSVPPNSPPRVAQPPKPNIAPVQEAFFRNSRLVFIALSLSLFSG
jgi:hypothetical protein